MASESTRKTASLEADAARTQERRPHGASAARPLRGTTVRTRNRPEKTSFLPEHGPENNDGKKTRTPCPAPLSPAQAGKPDACGLPALTPSTRGRTPPPRCLPRLRFPRRRRENTTQTGEKAFSAPWCRSPGAGGNVEARRTSRKFRPAGQTSVCIRHGCNSDSLAQAVPGAGGKTRCLRPPGPYSFHTRPHSASASPCPAPLSPAQAGKHDADGGKGVFRSVVPKPRRRRKRAFSPQKGADEVRLPPFSIRRQAQRFQRRGFFASDTPRCLRSFLLRRTRHTKPERPESKPCAGTAGTRRGASSRTRDRHDEPKKFLRFSGAILRGAARKKEGIRTDAGIPGKRSARNGHIPCACASWQTIRPRSERRQGRFRLPWRGFRRPWLWHRRP